MGSGSSGPRRLVCHVDLRDAPPRSTLEAYRLLGEATGAELDLEIVIPDGADATRVERIAPVITGIADKGGKVILLSHFGRPKGRNPKESLKPLAAEVAPPKSISRLKPSTASRIMAMPSLIRSAITIGKLRTALISSTSSTIRPVAAVGFAGVDWACRSPPHGRKSKAGSTLRYFMNIYVRSEH